ncbi:uncharacterized protein SPPG_03193 [Spizellomyces punctatus DAOM BR117]|uniref:SprT-like domain-containing protein n=1 Tax=Spizellomyces punctatus (strain DAOM BR117) TaxID=645134 RepID=A0A0L0HIU5_SPIPD|nr:uncharacterized protein SPPG_03193 [Spizellomyces punctatus DAOM BR117]KND01381.1 hypothetical protein SPPG_03193 [Spizellomyces punctatus DAOM BR117]|eukprot:XP_016609420.1 hypothetical protein SPPG_03193 [Spizellomyces punctatus DAOM BR117]
MEVVTSRSQRQDELVNFFRNHFEDLHLELGDWTGLPTLLYKLEKEADEREESSYPFEDPYQFLDPNYFPLLNQYAKRLQDTLNKCVPSLAENAEHENSRVEEAVEPQVEIDPSEVVLRSPAVQNSNSSSAQLPTPGPKRAGNMDTKTNIPRQHRFRIEDSFDELPHPKRKYFMRQSLPNINFDNEEGSDVEGHPPPTQSSEDECNIDVLKEEKYEIDTADEWNTERQIDEKKDGGIMLSTSPGDDGTVFAGSRAISHDNGAHVDEDDLKDYENNHQSIPRGWQLGNSQVTVDDGRSLGHKSSSIQDISGGSVTTNSGAGEQGFRQVTTLKGDCKEGFDTDIDEVDHAADKPSLNEGSIESQYFSCSEEEEATQSSIGKYDDVPKYTLLDTTVHHKPENIRDVACDSDTSCREDIFICNTPVVVKTAADQICFDEMETLIPRNVKTFETPSASMYPIKDQFVTTRKRRGRSEKRYPILRDAAEPSMNSMGSPLCDVYSARRGSFVEPNGSSVTPFRTEHEKFDIETTYLVHHDKEDPTTVDNGVSSIETPLQANLDTSERRTSFEYVDSTLNGISPISCSSQSFSRDISSLDGTISDNELPSPTSLLSRFNRLSIGNDGVGSPREPSSQLPGGAMDELAPEIRNDGTSDEQPSQFQKPTNGPTSLRDKLEAERTTERHPLSHSHDPHDPSGIQMKPETPEPVKTDARGTPMGFQPVEGSEPADEVEWDDSDDSERGILVFDGTPRKLQPLVNVWEPSTDALDTPKRTPLGRRPFTPSNLACLGTPNAAFKRQRVALSQQLFQEYNREIFESRLPSDLGLVWSKHLRTTAGRTFLKKELRNGKLEHVASIELSMKVLDDIGRLQSTLIHEMCHAAQWILNKVSTPPHGKVFKYWAARAECLYPQIKVTTCHSYDIACKYQYQCIKDECGRTYGRHSKSINVQTHGCGRCGGRLILLKPERIRKDGTPYKENRFTAFVKESFVSIKADNPDLNQRELMALIGKKFRTLSIENAQN